MARVVLTNLSSRSIFISKPRATLAPMGSPGDSKTIDGVKAADLDGNRDLETLVDAGDITVAVTDDPGQSDTQEGVVKSEVGSAALSPTAGEKAALPGTSGAPSALNKYVTNADPRNTNARAPTVHAVDHQDAGGDEIDVTGLSGLLADPQTPTAHAVDHEPGGGDAVGNVGYTPAMPAFWFGAPPATTKDAIDRLVAYLQPAGPALPGGPIP